MSGPCIVDPPPPRGARAAASRRKALTYRRLLEQGQWVGDKEPFPARAQASRRAQTMIDLCTRHGGFATGTLERAVWEVLSGPHSGAWRWAVRVKLSAEPG